MRPTRTEVEKTLGRSQIAVQSSPSRRLISAMSSSNVFTDGVSTGRALVSEVSPEGNDCDGRSAAPPDALKALRNRQAAAGLCQFC